MNNRNKEIFEKWINNIKFSTLSYVPNKEIETIGIIYITTWRGRTAISMRKSFKCDIVNNPVIVGWDLQGIYWEEDYHFSGPFSFSEGELFEENGNYKSVVNIELIKDIGLIDYILDLKLESSGNYYSNFVGTAVRVI